MVNPNATATITQQPEDVLHFWFNELQPAQWWRKDPALDAQITDRFRALFDVAEKGALDHWQQTPEGSLALVILLDQFPRNMFRDTPRAFASDANALTIARSALQKGLDASLPEAQRHFLYMPFMHSESLADHDQAMTLFSALGDESSLKAERQHRDIIARFGRYPHRNAILGRESTPAEQAFLEQPGSSF